MPTASPSQVVLNFFSSWKNVASSSLTNSTPFCAFLAQMTTSGGTGRSNSSCAHMTSGGAPARLDLVEHQRNVVNARQQAQPSA